MNGTNKKATSAQQLVDIEEVRDGVIVLKGGALRAILMVSSVNFSLKSAEEQDAIIFGYQSFLNSLDFPLQVIINSRRLKIDSYLKVLSDIEKEQTNDLLKMQTVEYSDFVKQLVEMSNIMSKTFYVVVPFSFMESKGTSVFSKIFSVLSAKKIPSAESKSFEKTKDQLLQRVGLISSSLKSLGAKSAMLKTQEVVELFYNIYNPDLSDREKIADMSDISINTKNVS